MGTELRRPLNRTRTMRVGALALALLLVACGNTTPSPPGKPVSGGTFNVRLTGDWTVFDPYQISSLNGSGVITAVYDRLIYLDKSNKLVPYLAKAWKATPNSVTFTLRNDVTCADGTRLTPTAVAKSFQRLIDKKQEAPQLWGPGPWTVNGDETAGTFTLSLGKPWSDALYSFTTPGASVICPTALAGDAAVAPSGSGPYTLVSATHGEGYVIKRRQGWNWGPNGLNSNTAGLPDTISFKIVTNDNTAANLLSTGGLDFGQVNGVDVQRLVADKSLRHVVGLGTYMYPLVFNEEPGHPTADDTIRKALMTAIDPAAYVKAAFSGTSHTGPSFLAPGTRCYDASVAKYLPKPSLDGARSILQTAGYTIVNGKLQKDGKALTVKLGSTSANFGRGPEYLLSQWTDLGVTVSFSDVDYASFSLALRNGNFDAGTENVAASNPATGSFIGYESGPTPAQGGANYAHNVDPTMVEMIQQAEATTGDESCKHWSDVQARMLTQHHMLPLGTFEYQWFGRGIEMDPAQYVNTISLRRVA